MPAGISPSTIENTLRNATGTVKKQAEALYPKIQEGADKLDGRLAKSKTYQKGKSTFQKALNHPKVEQFLNQLSKWFQQLSAKMSTWAENAGNRARAMTKANQQVNNSN